METIPNGAPAVRTGQVLAPIVPGWLDDAGLSDGEFRVLCHLWRRAGVKRTAFPSSASITKTTGVSDQRLWPILRHLEEMGFLRRQKGRHNSNKYILLTPRPTSPSVRVNDQSPVSSVIELPRNCGDQSLGIQGDQSPAKPAERSPWKPEDKGVSFKDVHEKEREQPGEAEPSLPPLLLEQQTQHAATTAGCTREGAAAGWTEFRNLKLLYRGDVKGRNGEEVFAMFLAWLRNDKRGKAVVTKFQAPPPPRLSPPVEGWRELVIAALAKESWGIYQPSMEAAVTTNNYYLLDRAVVNCLSLSTTPLPD